MTDKANWQQLDVDTLPADLQEAYKAYKQAYAEMKRIRDGFEATLRNNVSLPKGKRLAIAYNFGKLSVAVVDDDNRKPASKAGSISLASLRR